MGVLQIGLSNIIVLAIYRIFKISILRYFVINSRDTMSLKIRLLCCTRLRNLVTPAERSEHHNTTSKHVLQQLLL